MQLIVLTQFLKFGAIFQIYFFCEQKFRETAMATGHSRRKGKRVFAIQPN